MFQFLEFPFTFAVLSFSAEQGRGSREYRCVPQGSTSSEDSSDSGEGGSGGSNSSSSGSSDEDSYDGQASGRDDSSPKVDVYFAKSPLIRIAVNNRDPNQGLY
jgi:hypothetical protein